MGIPIQLIDLEIPFARDLGLVFSPADCAEILEKTQDRMWVAGTVNGREGREVRTELRDADVCFWRDERLAALLLARIQAEVPKQIRGNPLVGIRSSIRIYRYHPGQFFGLHRDQKYREDGCISHLALLIYLNTPEEGGDTWFPEIPLRVHPTEGRAMLFQNAALHAGEAVIAGQKLVLRGDVMYREG